MLRYRNVLLFALLAAIWGGAYPAIKVGLASLPPVLYAALRYDVAGVLMLGYVVVTTDYWRPRTRADWYSAAVGGVLVIAAYNAFLFIGELSIPSAVAGILVGLMPVFSAAFSQMLADENLDAAGVVGVALGFVGVAIISRPDPSNLLSSSVIGQLLVVAAAASMALGSVYSDRMDTSQPVVTMEAWSMVLGAVVLHVASLGVGEGLSDVTWTTEAMLMLAYLSVLSSAVAYFIYFDLLEKLGPFEMNFIAYAAAVCSAIVGWMVLDESVGVASVAGFLVILLGFALLKKDAVREVLGGWLPAGESA